MELLRECLRSVASLQAPTIWSHALDKIQEENKRVRRMVNSKSTFVYGANTEVGHRDDHQLGLADMQRLQDDIIRSHAISSPPFYSEYAARVISYVKIYSWAAGGSGISPAIYKLAIEMSTDKSFYPKIPTDSTYSSGDVIPGSHWAKEILGSTRSNKFNRPAPGDILAMINGAFVHVGYSASIVEKLSNVWAVFLELSALSHAVCGANGSNLTFFSTAERGWARDSILYLSRYSRRELRQNARQDPLSLRSLPQIFESLCDGISSYLSEINYLIYKPSGNPLFDSDSSAVLSQSSFLAPTLAIKTSALVESLLFAAWSVAGRVKYLLSGNVNNIPRDAACDQHMLGLIQHPKLLMAKLEATRMRNGRRLYSSGSETSYGVEDLWTNGVMAAAQLDSLLDDFFDICAIEAYILSYVNENLLSNDAIDSPLLKISPSALSLDGFGRAVMECVSSGGLPDAKRLFVI